MVWDREEGAIHGSPVDSAVPPAPSFQLDGLGNFQYYVESPPAINNRVRCLPWEFLVFVVNHRTTLPERKWAQLMYLPNQTMIGNCYGQVPYDGDTLKGELAKIAGKVYHLPNLYYYGGVCRHQADYAARVAKSLGVPAFAAGAATNLGEGHAWVMWTELGPVTRTGFHFSLESCGRYGDKFYVGGLSDPHTGLPTTHRQVELRLHTVAHDPLAKRQADLVMQAYPVLREKLALDLPQQLSFLGRIAKLCPGNEDVWKTLARLSREGRITKAHHKIMEKVLDVLFLTFRNCPDFTWDLFDDMVFFEDRPLRKADLYARLGGMYEQAKRVDLSCKARLKQAEILASSGQPKEAAASLAATILLFPDEGRYVPQLLDKLEDLCRGSKTGQQQLVLFYRQFLPKIPKNDGKNEYGVAMFKRATECFHNAGQEQLAQACRMQLKLMQEARPDQEEGRPPAARRDWRRPPLTPFHRDAKGTAFGQKSEDTGRKGGQKKGTPITAAGPRLRISVFTNPSSPPNISNFPFSLLEPTPRTAIESPHAQRHDSVTCRGFLHSLPAASVSAPRPSRTNVEGSGTE